MVNLFANVINEDRINNMSLDELKIVADIFDVDNKRKPDWYGIKGIKFIWHGAWADPEIQYKGRKLNATIIEDEMWERFRVENNSEDTVEFSEYMKLNANEVRELIEKELAAT